MPIGFSLGRVSSCYPSTKALQSIRRIGLTSRLRRDEEDGIGGPEPGFTPSHVTRTEPVPRAAPAGSEPGLARGVKLYTRPCKGVS